MDLKQKVDIEEDCGDDDCKAPAVTEGVAEDDMVCAEPAPVAAHWLISPQKETCCTCLTRTLAFVQIKCMLSIGCWCLLVVSGTTKSQP